MLASLLGVLLHCGKSAFFLNYEVLKPKRLKKASIHSGLVGGRLVVNCCTEMIKFLDWNCNTSASY